MKIEKILGYDVHRKKVKNINMRINQNMEVYISAPLNLHSSYIENFIRSKEEWIKKVKKDVEKKTEESEGGTISGTLGGNAWASGIEERTLELAKRYDKIHKK